MKDRELFFTDLDNTLIYSHRHDFGVPRIWVEELNGKKQSFMTGRSYAFFQNQNWLDVIPVTTRTRRQYERLQPAFRLLEWRDALVCNGAFLLHDGREDRSWTGESLKLAEKARPAFLKLLEFSKSTMGEEAVAAEEPFLFYIKAGKEADKVFQMLREQADLSNVQILRDSRKVYCFPKPLDKGTAVRRYMSRSRKKSCMAAGDSEFELPMLAQADICFYPPGHQEGIGRLRDPEGSAADGLLQIFGNEKKICAGVFADEICNILEKRSEEEDLDREC